MLLDVVASLSAGNFIAAHNAGGMQLVFDEVVGPFEEFGGHYDY